MVYFWGENVVHFGFNANDVDCKGFTQIFLDDVDTGGYVLTLLDKE